MATHPENKAVEKAARKPKVSESVSADTILPSAVVTPPSTSSAVFSIGTVGVIGLLFLAAYLVNSVHGPSLFEALVPSGAVLVGVLVGLTMAYIFWRLLAKRADLASPGLARELDFASELHLISAKVQSAACRLRAKSPQDAVDYEHANEIEQLAQQIAQLARYADLQLTRSSGDALSERRDAQLEQDLIIRRFQERYAQLRAMNAPEKSVSEAITILRQELRQANGGIPAPPLAAITAPIDAGCYPQQQSAEARHQEP